MDGVNFPPRRGGKRGQSCCVKNCLSHTARNTEFSFHKFPRPNLHFVKAPNYFDSLERQDVYDVWKKKTGIKNPLPHMKVCSRHFTRDDYLYPGKFVLFLDVESS